MRQKRDMCIKQLRKEKSRCSRFFRILRIAYSRWRLHRELRGTRYVLVLLHRDIWSLAVLESLYRYVEPWILLGYRYRVVEVKEKTIDGRVGLLLLSHGGKSICRTVIRMQQVDSGVAVFVIRLIDSGQESLP